MLRGVPEIKRNHLKHRKNQNDCIAESFRWPPWVVGFRSHDPIYGGAWVTGKKRPPEDFTSWGGNAKFESCERPNTCDSFLSQRVRPFASIQSVPHRDFLVNLTAPEVALPLMAWELRLLPVSAGSIDLELARLQDYMGWDDSVAPYGTRLRNHTRLVKSRVVGGDTRIASHGTSGNDELTLSVNPHSLRRRPSIGVINLGLQGGRSWRIKFRSLKRTPAPTTGTSADLEE